MSDFPLDLSALRGVLDHLNDAVYITDQNRKILIWNRRAEELTGHKAEDVVGHACYDNVLCHIDKEGHQLCISDLCPLHRSIRLNKPSGDPIIVYALKADGERLPVSVSTAPLHDTEGNVVGGIEVFRDESARMRDLEFARRIQRHIMPENLPDLPGYSVEALCYPHDMVGGDFYDVRRISPSQCSFFVADVRGHGVSAALYTMWLKSIAEHYSSSAEKPGAFLGQINEELSRHILDESFATAIYGVLDCDQHKFICANAGHPSPLLCNADGSVFPVGPTGMPLGVSEFGEYSEVTIPFAPDDAMLLYTDGATEAVTRSGTMLGQNGLAQLMEKSLSQNRTGIAERIYRDLTKQIGDVNLADDLLLVSVTRT